MENPDAVSVSNSESEMNDNSSSNEKELILNYYNDIISGRSSFAQRAASFDPAEASRQAPYVPSPSITRTPIMPMASLTSFGHNDAGRERLNTATVTPSTEIDPVQAETPPPDEIPAPVSDPIREKSIEDQDLSSKEVLVSPSYSDGAKSPGLPVSSNDELISSITSSIDYLLSQMDRIAAHKTGNINKPEETVAAEVTAVEETPAAEEIPVIEEVPVVEDAPFVEDASYIYTAPEIEPHSVPEKPVAEDYIPVNTVEFDFTDISFLSDSTSGHEGIGEISPTSDHVRLSPTEQLAEKESPVIVPDVPDAVDLFPAEKSAEEEIPVNVSHVPDAVDLFPAEKSAEEEIPVNVSHVPDAVDLFPAEKSAEEENPVNVSYVPDAVDLFTPEQPFEEISFTELLEPEIEVPQINVSPAEIAPMIFGFDDTEPSSGDIFSAVNTDSEFRNILAELESASDEKTDENAPFSFDASGFNSEDPEFDNIGPDVTEISFKEETQPEFEPVLEKKPSLAENPETNAEPIPVSEPGPEVPSFPQVSQVTGTFVVPFEGTVEFHAVEPVRHSETTLFDISGQLQAASLAKDYTKVYTTNNLSAEGKETLLSVKNVDSIYYISRGGVKPYKVCERLRFELKAGSICGLVSDVRLASYVTAREIAERCEKLNDNSVRVSGSGDNSGMLYIGSDRSIPGDITLKSYLVSVCSGEDYKTVSQRVGLIISQLGLGNLENTPLYDISSCKKVLILMTAAALNDSVKCVIVNDPAFKITMEDDMLARRVCELLNTNGKCALISCGSDLMVSSVCNKVLVMKEGRDIYFGSFVNFVDSNCLNLLSVNAAGNDAMLEMLETNYPNITCDSDGNTLYLSLKPDEGSVDLEQLINDLNGSGADTTTVRVENKSFVSAKKEVYSE